MKHLNESVIQAFLDSELADEATERVTQHIALCPRCANALCEAEAGQAEVNFAFAAEAASPVPSQRIWARIENEIDFLDAPGQRDAIKIEAKSFWQQWTTFFPSSQIAFAGGLAIVIFASFFAVQILRQAQPKIDDVAVTGNHNPETSDLAPKVDVAIVPTLENTAPIAVKRSSLARPTKVLDRQTTGKPVFANPKSKIQNPKSFPVLPEEHNYLNSIAELSKAVEASDEFVMRPSFRVDYERNLAVMDNAISAMQKQVRQNPKDENAKRILFASYQNKIELLNTVAEKSQMIASLR